jgi:hypothetical protein
MYEHFFFYFLIELKHLGYKFICSSSNPARRTKKICRVHIDDKVQHFDIEYLRYSYEIFTNYDNNNENGYSY